MLRSSGIGWEARGTKMIVGEWNQKGYEGPTDNTVDLVFDESGQLANLCIGDIWDQR